MSCSVGADNRERKSRACCRPGPTAYTKTGSGNNLEAVNHEARMSPEDGLDKTGAWAAAVADRLPHLMLLSSSWQKGTRAVFCRGRGLGGFAVSHVVS